MIYEKAMQLVKALRGRGYRQGSGALKSGPRTHCCLGVACQIAGLKPKSSSTGWWTYKGNHEFLPISVQDEFGFYSEEGTRSDGEYIIIDEVEYASLANVNDDKVPFRKIADYIENNWKDL